MDHLASTSARPVRPPRRLASLVVLVVVLLTTAAPAGAAGADPVGTWPLAPQPDVVQRFAPPPEPWAAGHRGVDLAGTPGLDVRAALAGTVTFAGSLAGRGVVVVDHGATRTTYEPVTSALAAGTAVPAGGVLGTLQAAPSHCAPRSCLHWGWIEDPDTYLDPLRLVGAGPVRLLPWAGLPAAAPAAGAAVSVAQLLQALLTPGGGPGGRPSAAGRW